MGTLHGAEVAELVDRRNPVNYVMRHGRRIEVVTINPDVAAPKRRRSFEPKWVKLPRHWISSLGSSKSVNTYRLAHLILMEAYRDTQGDGWINLSTHVTGMPRSTKGEAARELAELGLISLKPTKGTKVLKARIIHYDYYQREESKRDKNRN
jgi:hypothetical protein